MMAKKAPVVTKPKKAEPEPEPSKPDPKNELLARWRDKGVLSEQAEAGAAKPTAKPSPAESELSGLVARKDRPKSGVWGGTDWMKTEPTEDTIEEEDGAGQTDSLHRRELEQVDFPSSDNRANVFGGKLKPAMRDEHPMVRQMRDADVGLHDASSLPKKMQIDDGLALMANLRQRTDTQAYTSEAEPGREQTRPTVRRDAVHEEPSIEALMTKPKVAGKIKMRDTAALPPAVGGGDDDDDEFTSF